MSDQRQSRNWSGNPFNTQVQIGILDLCITADAERVNRRPEVSVVYLMFNAHEFEGGKKYIRKSVEGYRTAVGIYCGAGG
jgi:hypothetical protein